MTTAGWELIAGRRGLDTLERIKVPGGWLYRTVVHDDGAAIHMVFVPDSAPREEPEGVA